MRFFSDFCVGLPRNYLASWTHSLLKEPGWLNTCSASFQTSAFGKRTTTLRSVPSQDFDVIMFCKNRWSLAVPTGTMQYEEQKDHSIWPDSSLFRVQKTNHRNAKTYVRWSCRFPHPPSIKRVIVAGFQPASPKNIFGFKTETQPHAQCHTKNSLPGFPPIQIPGENRHRSPVINA